MTLDEAIKHCKEVAKQQEVKANELYKAKDFEESRDCIWCSKEHEQLAEWLKELKKFREQQPYEKFESTKDHIYKLAGDYKCWDNRLTEDEAVELCHILEQQPCYNPDEWCHDCSEYNHDKHCCPRYNKVIRNAVEEMKQPKVGHWISYWDEEARCHVYKCPECGNKQPFDTKCCWECGTRLIEPQESEE